jgi:beta-glucosidase
LRIGDSFGIDFLLDISHHKEPGGQMRLIVSIILLLCNGLFAQGIDERPASLNPDLFIETRVDDLVSRMTLEEKVSQMVNGAKAIPRLQIPEYNWWNECLHRVARSGNATVFPHAIGRPATWNTDLMLRPECRKIC